MPPEADHAAFGPVTRRKLSRLEKFAAARLARSWAAIPHVTHHDEADITALEALRAARPPDAPKLTVLAFLMKAASRALQEFPLFNASLDSAGEELTLKQYVHVGFAVDTPRGLVVPVIRDVDRKPLATVAQEISDTTVQARAKGLPIDRMSGGCFSISSLGGIGGTAFTPIINAPEVAILGVARACEKPRRDVQDQIVWRQMLPLSLSYDHRVINGADAARFCRFLADRLAEPGSLE